jgi:hypothetical protein
MIISYEAWEAVRDERKLGYVAEFCPVCREIRACRLFRVGEKFSAEPLNGAPRIANVVRCQHCPFTTPVDALTYASMAKTPSSDIEQLIQQTNPQIRTKLAGSLALAESLKQPDAQVSSGLRQSLLLEPFQHLAGPLEVMFRRNKKLDRPTISSGLVTIVLTFLLVGGCTAFSHGPRDDDKWFLAVALAAVIGGLFTLVQHALGAKRRVRTEFIPALANALRPLKPTREELATCVSTVRADGWRLGKEVQPDQLWSAVEDRLAA